LPALARPFIADALAPARVFIAYDALVAPPRAAAAYDAEGSAARLAKRFAFAPLI
jgi:hypothetical protein